MSVSRSAGPAVTRAQHIPHDSAQLAAGSPAGLTATPHFRSLPLTLRPWGSPVFPWPRAKPGSGSFPHKPIRQHLHLLMGSAVGRTLGCAIPAGVLGSPPALTRHSLLPTRATLPWYRQGLGLSPHKTPILALPAPPPFAARRAAQVDVRGQAVAETFSVPPFPPHHPFLLRAHVLLPWPCHQVPPAHR